MTIEPIAEVRQYLALLSDVLGPGIESAIIERLGGMTNRVFKITSAAGSFCLRLPGAGTAEYIDRAAEAVAAREAARIQIAPELLHVDPAVGILVTRYVAGAVTMTPELFRTRQHAPARAAKAFAGLHRSSASFSTRFALFSMIDSYLGVLGGKTVDLPQGYHDALKAAQAVRAALDGGPLPSCACHCDPLAENFLDDGERMWIVDWEYSGMNDPLWDLADLSIEAEFDPSQEAMMLQAYFRREPRVDEYGRVVIYKAMCDLLWTLWGLIQHANGNPAEDFWQYSINRFERCMALMSTAGFAGHVNAVKHRVHRP